MHFLLLLLYSDVAGLLQVPQQRPVPTLQVNEMNNTKKSQLWQPWLSRVYSSKHTFSPNFIISPPPLSSLFRSSLCRYWVFATGQWHQFAISCYQAFLWLYWSPLGFLFRWLWWRDQEAERERLDLWLFAYLAIIKWRSSFFFFFFVPFSSRIFLLASFCLTDKFLSFFWWWWWLFGGTGHGSANLRRTREIWKRKDFFKVTGA